MRILYLTPWFPSHRQDQTGNFILDSVEAVAALGHECNVLVSTPWRPPGSGWFSPHWHRRPIALEGLPDNIKLHTAHYLSVPRSLASSFSNRSYLKHMVPLLSKLAEQYRCDLIHAHTELAATAAVAAGQQIGLPSVVTLHGISTDKKLYQGRTRRLFFEYALPKTDRVILVGDPLVNFFKSLSHKHDHFRVVYNGFRASSINQANMIKKWDDEKLRFISVSNLQEGKGIDLNLQALALLKKANIHQWTYHIIGAGSERKKLEALCQQLGLCQQVFFMGACDHHTVYQYLSQADIFILPSYREAFGIAYLEAMSCGLLAIGVEGQGAHAFIQHDQTGFLVPPRQVEPLFMAIKKLFMLSKTELSGIAEAGKQYVHRQLTWQIHAKHLVKLYQDVLGENKQKK